MVKTKSIFFRLTALFIVLGLLPLLAAGAVLFFRFQKHMEQVILDDMSRTVGYAGTNADEMAAECHGLTGRIYDISTENGLFLYQIIKDTIPEKEKELEIALLLNKLLDGDSRIRSVYFLDEQEKLFYATRNTQKVLNKRRFLEWVGAESREECVSVLYTHADDYFPESDNQVITFGRSYQDITSFQTLDDRLGYFYMDVDLGRLSSVLSDLSMGVNEEFCILDDQGKLIYQANSAGNMQAGESMEAFLPFMEGGSGSLLRNGSYVVYDRLKNCGWTAAARADRSSVLRNLDSTRRYIVVFLSSAFFVLLCLYFYFLKGVRRSVRLLEQGMASIQKGELDTRIDVGNREDEIGSLADGLNNMASELESYIKRVYVAEIRQRDAELTAIKSQIKPHYLYNTLEVIRMTALEHDDKEAARMVESLSKQLKYLIGYNSDMVSLKREIENIREYFYIMRIRYENRIQLEVSVDEDVMEAAIMKLSLQPVVENAVKHGLRRKKGSGTVRIEAHGNGKILEITVMDDGVGMTPEALKALTESLEREEMGVRTDEGWEHVGLKNVCDRIRKIFGREYGLEIMSTEGMGTIVVYTLPLDSGGNV